MAQFLHKLPTQVVRDGKLLDIRESVAKVLQVPYDASTRPALYSTVYSTRVALVLWRKADTVHTSSRDL